MIKLASSICSGPLVHLQETIQNLEAAGVDYIHIDIEDGCFVPAMNLGVKVIRELRPWTALPFDVHLMMLNPEWLLPQLAEDGANRVSVHYEACEYPRRTLGLIARHDMQAGLAFNPKTPIPPLQQYLPYLRFVVILTTEPETGDCPYLPAVLQKVRAGKAQVGLDGVEWIVDGGITAQNAREAVLAGADILVSGRGIFGPGGLAHNIQQLRTAANDRDSE